MRLLLIVVLLLSVAPGLPLSSAKARGGSDMDQDRLSLVRKIYVGDMGTADEADRFRLLLEDKLSKRGFVIVERPEIADAILTGALSVRVFDDKSEARAFVRLTTQAGDRIWSREFGSRLIFNPFKRAEPVKRRAEEVADRLREDWRKSGGK
jgi:predicted enzyme involved in methoxymalonyl-ACP biosynthesis